MTRRTFHKLSLTAFAGFAMLESPLAQVANAAEWIYLGEANVDGKNDHDMIRVGASAGKYRAIQLKVAGGAIDFMKVIVHFANGTREPLDLRERIPAGGKTRVIDLPGERRSIQSVELFYSRANWGSHRPKVRLFAKV